MKKFFLLSVLALCAMTMSAQLTLQCTINDLVNISTSIGYGESYQVNLPVQFLFYTISSKDSCSLKLFDINDGSLFKTIEIGEYRDVWYASKNFWTTNGKVSFLAIKEEGEYFSPKIIDEDGNVVQTLPTSNGRPVIIDACDGYKLYITEEINTRSYLTHIYSIPGNGQPTDLESPTAPARTSNARKVVENGQVYIILDGVKYAVTGSSTL